MLPFPALSVSLCFLIFIFFRSCSSFSHMFSLSFHFVLSFFFSFFSTFFLLSIFPSFFFPSFFPSSTHRFSCPAFVVPLLWAPLHSFSMMRVKKTPKSEIVAALPEFLQLPQQVQSEVFKRLLIPKGECHVSALRVSHKHMLTMSQLLLQMHFQANPMLLHFPSAPPICLLLCTTSLRWT